MKCLCGMTCFAGQIWPVGRSLETLQEISWTFISWLCMCMHSIFCTVVPQPLIQKSIRDNVAAPFHQSLSQRSEWLTRKSRCRFRKQDILNLYAIAVCRWTLHIDSFFCLDAASYSLLPLLQNVPLNFTILNSVRLLFNTIHNNHNKHLKKM